MSTSYNFTDTTVSTSVTGCVGRVNGVAVPRRQIGGTLGSGTATATVGGVKKSTVRAIVCAMFTAASDPGLTSWAAGTATVPLDVSSGNSNCKLDEIFLCQVNSSLTNVATYGSSTALALTATTQVFSRSVTCSALSPSNTDRLGVFYVFSNATGVNQSVTLKFDQVLTVPYGAAASRGLFRQSALAGLGAGGSFFADPLAGLWRAADEWARLLDHLRAGRPCRVPPGLLGA